MRIQFFFKKTGFFLLSIYNQNMDFLSEVFMLTEFGNWIEQGLTWVIEHFDEPLWNITIVILLGVGLFFTITTGVVQLRLFPTSIREMWFGRAAEGNSLTPFQAFATGLASRVGVGNISGVATAIALGGNSHCTWWRRGSILDVGNGIYWDVECFCRIDFSTGIQNSR